MKKENCKIKRTSVLSVTVFLLMTVLMGFECSKDKLAGISAVRDISGNWTTPASVNFYMTSDGCGTYARYNRTPIKLRWNITYISDTEVDVDISATNIGTTTQLQSNCGLPATLNFPLFYHGKVSATNLLLFVRKMQYNNNGGAIGMADVTVGDFMFTSNSLTGTLFEKDCPIYCAGYETDPLQCKLTR